MGRGAGKKGWLQTEAEEEAEEGKEAGIGRGGIS